MRSVSENITSAQIPITDEKNSFKITYFSKNRLIAFLNLQFCYSMNEQDRNSVQLLYHISLVRNLDVVRSLSLESQRRDMKFVRDNQRW